MSVTARRVGLGVAALLLASVVLRAPDLEQLLQFTILGVAAGAVYAIAASGVVLTYATTGVFNFAHGGLGMISAFAYWQLTVEWDLPAPVAALIVLGGLGPVLGLLLERTFRGLRQAEVGSGIVMTVAVTVLCIGVAQYLFEPDQAHNLPSIISGPVHLFGTTITWDDVLKIGAAAAIALGLRSLLFGTRAGTTMRAVVDDPSLAALNGASSTAVARGSWILGTELAMVAGLLIGAGTNLEAITLTFFVVNAYGAAVIGKLRSLPLTFAGAIVLGLVQSWGSAFWFPKGPSGFALADGEHWRRIGLGLPGIFLFVALLFLPQARLTVARRVRRRDPAVPGLRTSIVGAVLFVGAVGVVSSQMREADLGDATRALVFSVILLSLVVLAGYSGQVSLAQYVFVALGAWAMGSAFGGSSPFGLVAAALAPVAIAVVVALPAIRLQGLYLALVTFGFAAVSRELVIQDRFFFGGDAVQVGRPTVLGVSFEGDRAFLVLCGIVFAALGVAVLALKRGPLGRRFAAVRDSEAACATLGLDPRRTKLLAFCLSASIAGVGGALFGGSQLTVSDIPFEPINNIVLFLFAVVGGVTTISGAFLGGVLFALLPYVQSHHPDLAGLVFAGIAAVAISLGRQPNGLAGIVVSWLHLLRRPAALRGAAVVALVGVVLLGAAPAVHAAGEDDPFAAFGGLDASSRSGGVQISYDVKGVLPLPPPLVEVTVPTARAASSSGPASLAFGSLAYPGDLVGNLPALAEQSAPGGGGIVPPYPIATLAAFPAGPESGRQDLGTASSTVTAAAGGATATSTLAATQVPGLVDVAGVTTSSRTGLEDGRVVARARTEVARVAVLFGLVELRNVVTDLVAATDGSTGRSGGTTTVGSATVLGLPARVGPDGLELAGTTTPPDAVLAAVLDPLLAAAGLHVSLAPLTTDDEDAAATATAAGLEIGLDFDGSGDNPLAQLLALLPSDQLPGEAIPGVPLNTSPQALVNLLKETHVVGVAIGPARAQVDASPAAAVDEGVPIGPAFDGGLPSTHVADGFTTPLPDLEASPASRIVSGGGPGGLVTGRAVGVAIVVLALLSLPLWSIGAARLMDASLVDGGPGCADGDRKLTRGGPRGRRSGT